MRIQQIITFNWWSDGKKEVLQGHRENLEDHANNHIRESRLDGHTSGQLFHDIDEIKYQGFWDMTSKVID